VINEDYDAPLRRSTTMKTQITRFLGTLALAAALLTTSTAAFAATPDISPSLYDDASDEGDYVANGLEFGGAALGVGAAVVDAAAGGTDAGQATAGGLSVGNTVLTDVAAPIVRIATQ
jgi:hypothetical protein